METKELIGYLKSLRDYKDELAWELRGKIDRKIVLDEIIQNLREYGELKKMLHDIVDPLIDVCEFLLAVLGEDE